MNKEPNMIGIILANLFFVALFVCSVIALWWKSMYSVGMGVEFYRIMILATVIISIVTTLLSWLTLKITTNNK